MQSGKKSDRVVVFDEDGKPRAFDDLEIADAAMEITDRPDDSGVEVIYFEDGRVVEPRALAGGRVRLIASGQQDVEGFRSRLANYARMSGQEFDVGDLTGCVDILIGNELKNVWPRWPNWLTRGTKRP